MNLQRMLLILSSLSLFISTSCSTVEQSTLFGAAVGGTVGAGFGAAAGSADHNELSSGAVGLVTGAAFGALAGYLTHHQEEKDKARRSSQVEDSFVPSIDKPTVRRLWVPDKVEDSRYERGHFIYQIEKPSSWAAPDDGDGHD